jgi:AcrR family transcriptional regulator
MKSKSRVARSQEEIRAAILTAAREYISRYGVAKTTVDDIAQAVNMAKSSLYYYFTSKEDLFKAVFDEEFQKFKTSINDAVAAEDAPIEKIRSYAIARFHAFNNLSIFHTALKDNNYRAVSSISQMNDVFNEYEISLVESILSQGVDQGLFALKDATLTGKAVALALKFFQFEWAQYPDEKKIIESIDNLLHLLQNGILSR